jgi:hypothetical protein
MGFIQIPATQKQQDYIEILCNDVGLDTRAKRNDFISIRIGRKIQFLDEIWKHECSALINELKQMKESQKTTFEDIDPRFD